MFALILTALLAAQPAAPKFSVPRGEVPRLISPDPIPKKEKP